MTDFLKISEVAYTLASAACLLVVLVGFVWAHIDYDSEIEGSTMDPVNCERKKDGF